MNFGQYYLLGNWDNIGVPYYLYDSVTVEPDLGFRLLNMNISEKNANNDLFIKTDVSTFTGANLYATYLYTETNNNDLVGYYSYNLNENYKMPTKWDKFAKTFVPMTFEDKDKVNEFGKSILKKTVIFPNASLVNGPNQMVNGPNQLNNEKGKLIPGDRVKLLYDTSIPNLKFKNNTGVGFFIVKNGWNEIQSTGITGPTGPIGMTGLRPYVNADNSIYTGLTGPTGPIGATGSHNSFNPNLIVKTYAPSQRSNLNIENDSNTIIYSDSVFNNYDSIKTILRRDTSISNTNNFIICLSDTNEHDSISNFTDISLRISCEPDYATDNMNFPKLQNTRYASNNIYLDGTGFYVQISNISVNMYKNLGVDTHYMVHTITMYNINNSYVKLNNLLHIFNLESNVSVSSTNDSQNIDYSEINTITITKIIENNNLSGYNYYFKVVKNQNIIDPDSNTLAIIEFKKLYIDDIDNSIINRTLFMEDPTSSKNNINNSNITPKYSDVMIPYALGDPHITTIYGTKYDLHNRNEIYEFYNNGEIIINAKLDNYPPNKTIIGLQDLTFISIVSLKLGSEKIYIDMFNQNTYYKKNEIGDLEKTYVMPNFFTIYDENSIETRCLSRERRIFYEKIIKKNFALQFIKFKTIKLGYVYLELLYAPQKKDLVSSVCILNKNLMMTDARGVLVHKKYANPIVNL